ncbi:MAG TPA: DegT/DnrJ/EryC1/StrS family aminotransferase [Gemmatimonadales bacterium]|nr:DegT/DnrJ/EryC1/StrS family aminotransferase [Gemmatimonadales bacterium]
MSVPMLDLKAQHETIKADVMARVASVIDRQQFIMGPEIAELEREIATLCGVPHAIGCASGTDALLLPLKALDLSPGDEVICPAFTFFATAGAIHNAGGTPVFVDIHPDTFNLDPECVARAITPRTRAIVVVHLYGQMAPMEWILEVATKAGIPVIEDAAQAIGARRKIDGAWRMAGELGAVGTISFFPSKNLGGWGDGGMMVCKDDDLAGRLSRLRLHGGARQYHHEEVGFNSRLDAIQAAVLLAKLPHLAEWSAARRERAARYSALLEDVRQVRTPVTDPKNEAIFHQYTLRVQRRDALREHLTTWEIASMVYYPVPLHLQPCFAHLGMRLGSLPETERAMDEVISLPIYPELTDAQQDEVVGAIRAFYG